MENSIESDPNGNGVAAQGQPLVVAGIRLASGASGVRYSDRDDLTIIEIAESSHIHCLFTRNKFCAAPVTIAQRHLATANTRFLIINAGNANAGTGVEGERTAVRTCEALANYAGCSPPEVLPFSTGVIGEQLETSSIEGLIPDLLSSLSPEAWPAAAAAIMTTDTVPKVRSQRVRCGDAMYTVTGIAKGSGMIKPDMATMLAYVATDAALTPALLQGLTIDAANQSFNRITVDGDTSTNDSFALIATGQAGSDLIESVDHDHYDELVNAVSSVCRCLAQDIVRDGEGATKFVTVHVRGGQAEADCLRIAYAVAESPLVKTALFAGDPNWGRILAAIGRAEVDELSIDHISIAIGGYGIVSEGEPVPGYDESKAATLMKQDEVEIDIEIGSRSAYTTVWTCDLSYEYVKINAEYRS